ncbi:MAG: cation:proton antiporter [Chitinophagaceae bacterium]|nr:cation:proton antiporter [Chitinophagaceae bacterium]
MLPTILNITDFSLPLKSPVLIFSTILFIILFAPIVLNKVRIPHLIGLIIAGALIGPKGFYLMERDASFKLFGQVGLLYIMFLAGLEIDLAEFKKNSLKSGVFGMYTFLIPMTLGTLSGLYLLHFSLPSSILLASIFASHTLIAYPLISKLGVAKNRAVNITIGGTIITDILALLVMAGIVGMYGEHSGQHFWLKLGLSVITMGAVVLLGFPVVGRWFFKRVDDRVSQYIFVLGMVFLAAFLSELAGVEPIIGAFLAGLALNKLVPHTSPLMNRIEFVGNALFIPFFLIGIGMLIDYRVFFKDLATLKVALIITIMATLGKYAAAWLAQKTFGYTTDERRLIFGLSNAHVAAALAVVLVGYNTVIGKAADGTDLRLFDETVLNATIVLILITCTIASFVAQKGARNISLLDNTNEKKDDGDFDEKIMLATNQPEVTADLMELAINLKTKNNREGVFVLNIMDAEQQGGPSSEKNAQQIFKMATETAAATDHYVHQLRRYDVNVVNGIASVCREHHITDLILGVSRFANQTESFLGDIPGSLLQRINNNMLVYRPRQPIATIRRHIIVVPEKAEREIGFALWLVKFWNIQRNAGAKLVFYGAQATHDVVKSIAAKHPLQYEAKVFTDWDDFLILGRELKENDCLHIVMSRKGHPSYTPAMNRIPYYLGNYFTANSFVMIYPVQTLLPDTDSKDLQNPSVLEPLQENLERMDDVVKTITRLFKRR